MQRSIAIRQGTPPMLKGYSMLNKHYEMLGDAVRRARNEVLSSEELGKLIMQYVELLQQEAMRDERDIINGKGV